MVNYFFEDVSLPIKLKKKQFYIYLKNYCISLGFKLLNINYIFCNDEYLLTLNRDYLNHDDYTDTITFNYSDKYIISGDIFISVDRLIDNYKSFHTTFEEELYRVMIHGFLHLLGYVDKETSGSKNQMLEKQELLLKDFMHTIVSRETGKP